jgi:opacity protein-like surface antigen
MKTRLAGLAFLLCGAGVAFGQASATATRTLDLQVGGGFNLANSDFETNNMFRGGTIYASADFRHHLGAEIDFHQANSPTDSVYERTYEIGASYHREYGRFVPYGKVMYGRGVFNFPTFGTIQANLAFNEFSFGGGVDFHLLRFLNLRGDYEYQDWHSFKPNGLTPQVLTIGVAYHFPGGLGKGHRF